MDYFRMQQDERCRPYPYIKGIIDVVRPWHDTKEYYSNMSRHNGVFVTSSRYNVYTDVMDRQIYLVSNTVKAVFDLYARDILYTHFCLIDNPNDTYHYYFFAMFDEVDCLHSDSHHNLDKSRFEHIALKRSAIGKRHIFRVQGVGTKMIIVSLQVAESLLRRKVTGVKFTPVELR